MGLTASTLIGVGIALVAVWLAFGIFVFALRSPGQSVGEILRVFPDSLRLATALYRDRRSGRKWKNCHGRSTNVLTGVSR